MPNISVRTSPILAHIIKINFSFRVSYKEEVASVWKKLKNLIALLLTVDPRVNFLFRYIASLNEKKNTPMPVFAPTGGYKYDIPL